MVVHWAVFVHFELKKQSTNKLKHKQTKPPRQTKTQTQTQKRILSKVLIVEALTPFFDFESGTQIKDQFFGGSKLKEMSFSRWASIPRQWWWGSGRVHVYCSRGRGFDSRSWLFPKFFTQIFCLSTFPMSVFPLKLAWSALVLQSYFFVSFYHCVRVVQSCQLVFISLLWPIINRK